MTKYCSIHGFTTLSWLHVCQVKSHGINLVPGHSWVAFLSQGLGGNSYTQKPDVFVVANPRNKPQTSFWNELHQYHPIKMLESEDSHKNTRNIIKISSHNKMLKMIQRSRSHKNTSPVHSVHSLLGSSKIIPPLWASRWRYTAACSLPQPRRVGCLGCAWQSA